MSRILISAVLAVLFVAPAFADSFSSLEERMSAKDFKAAGLDKLSAEELAALNDWLRRGSVAPQAAAAPAIEDRRGFAVDRDVDTSTIASRVAGRFRGWDGVKTIVTLENGQVWQSTDPGARMAVNLESPAVTIESGIANAWFMRIDGYNTVVRVKRIK